METVITLVTLAMTLLVLGLVGLPLLKERKQDEDDFAFDEAQEDPEVDTLLSKKETALAAIHELEFDYAVGNLSDQDYLDLKEKYGRRAIAVLKSLDEVTEAEARGREEGKRTVRARRAKRGGQQRGRDLSCPGCGEPFEAGDAFCASCGSELGGHEDASLACVRCGEPYEAGDAFCASCGASLPAMDQQTEPDDQDFPSSAPAEESFKALPPVQSGGPARRRRRQRRPARPGSPNGNGRET